MKSGSTSYTIGGSTTIWIKPDTLDSVIIECIGGGGQGQYSDYTRSGGAGGGGAYSLYSSNTLYTNLSVYVGLGGYVQNFEGTRYHSTNSQVYNGATTYCLAARGKDCWDNGNSWTDDSGTGCDCVNGALGGSASNCIGDIKLSGGDGFCGQIGDGKQGGEGGSAGGPFLKKGGIGGMWNQSGFDSDNPGGGGGGAGVFLNSGGGPGFGANGKVIITYYYY